MSNTLTTNQADQTSKKPKHNPKVLTWTIFSYLGTFIFIGFGIWSTYYFSLPNYAKDYIASLNEQGMHSFAQFVQVWQYTFFPWCLLGLTCLLFAVTGTIKLKDNNVGRPKRNNKKTKRSFGY